MSSKMLSLRWIFSHLFVVSSVVLMMGLGFWQLNRLADLRAENNLRRQAMSRQPVDIVGIIAADPADVDDPADAIDTVDVTVAADDTGQPFSHSALSASLVNYSPVTITGVYKPDSEVQIGHRSYHGQPGVWLATPLSMSDGRKVLVVRGWVPRRVLSGLDSRPTSPPEGEVVVSGLAFTSVDGGKIAETAVGMTPELSQVDLERFTEVTGVQVLDMWVRLVEQSPSQSDLPVPVEGLSLDDGPHLSYALQWFFFSLGTVVAYVLILRRVMTQTVTL